MSRPRLNKLNECHALVKLTKSQLATIDKQGLNIKDRNEFANELGAAYEALEFLRIKIQSMAMKAGKK